MIDSITGIIKSKSPSELKVSNGGFVFNINICIKDFEVVGELGSEITILTYLNVKEDLLELYGFIDEKRRNIFLKLIQVSGIGPKTAIGLLSNITVESFKQNILSEDHNSLSLIPGIGPKTAKRIIIELKEKISSTSSNKTSINSNKFSYDELFTAIASLGYKKNQIDKAIQRLFADSDAENIQIEDAIKRILTIIK
jgi:Holliday junction DNA helicase RuvA